MDSVTQNTRTILVLLRAILMKANVENVQLTQLIVQEVMFFKIKPNAKILVSRREEHRTHTQEQVAQLQKDQVLPLRGP